MLEEDIETIQKSNSRIINLIDERMVRKREGSATTGQGSNCGKSD